MTEEGAGQSRRIRAEAAPLATLLSVVVFAMVACGPPGDGPSPTENAPPIAEPMSISAIAGEPRSGLLRGMDPDGDVLSYTLVDPPGLGAVVVQLDGRFTYQAPADVSGVDAFSYTASDGEHTSDPAEVTVNVIAPPWPTGVLIDQGPPSPAATGEAAFGFSRLRPGQAMCRIDDDDPVPCESPVIYSGLSEGWRLFEVWLEGEAAPPARWRWEVDLTPPATRIDVHPPALSRWTDATFAFTADEPATFTCRLNEGAWTPCESPWVYPGLSDGAYRFEVRAADRAGHVDSDPPVWEWMVDTVPPVSAIVSPTGLVTGNPSPTFELVADEPATFACRLNGSRWAPCESPHVVEAGYGGHVLEVRAADLAGNVEIDPSRRSWYATPTFTELTEVPSPFIPTPEVAVGFQSFANVAAFECRLDDGAWEACESPVVYEGLGEGTYTVSVRATEADGTVEAAPPSTAFEVDLTPPVVTIVDGPPALTNETESWFEISASEPVTLECRLDAGDWVDCETPFLLSDIPDGERRLEVRAFDLAGNESVEMAVWTWTVDTVPPGVTIDSAPPVETDEREATFAFSCDKPPCTFECRRQDTDWAPCDSPVGYAELAEGVHLFAARAIDDLGNVSAIPATWTWFVFVDMMPFAEVATYGDRTCATRTDGSLWCWGPWPGGAHRVGALDGWSGLAVGGRFIDSEDACALGAGGTLWCWQPEAGDEPEQVGSEGGWAAVAMGNDFQCALRDEGTLWCWGRNSSGQLGVGDTTHRDAPTQVGSGDDWTHVAAGHQHACGLRGDGELWCWGYNLNGQVGVGDTTSRISPARVGSESDWFAVAGGEGHTCGLRAAGELWCWGRNWDGQLGLGNTSNRSTPWRVGDEDDWGRIAAGAAHTCGIRDGEHLWCWGNNAHGATGQAWSGSTDRRLVPEHVDLYGASGWVRVLTGHSRTCGLREAGDLWCWGRNDRAQLGLGEEGDLPWWPQPVDGDRSFALVDAAFRSQFPQTCAIDTGGAPWCWGRMTPVAPQVTEARQHPVRVDGDETWVAVAATGHVACGVREGGAMWCWRPWTVREDRVWVEIASGDSHACALDEDSGLWCWGSNSVGQLGDGTTDASDLPVQVSAGSAWVQVDTVGWHTCGLRADATLWCWGGNNRGQLGIGSTDHQSEPVQVAPGTTWRQVTTGQEHTCGIRSDDTLWCWGYGWRGRLGLGSTTSYDEPIQVEPGTTWRRVSAGFHHTCAVDGAEALWCWGWGRDGRLGNGDLAQQTSPVPIGPDGARWVDVSSGNAHACAIQDDDSLWCWGANDYGQIGNGRAWMGSPQLVP